MKKICFTGRRPKDLAGYKDASKYSKFIDMMATYLASEVTDDTTFISGGAQGFDQLAFWAVDIAKSRVNGNFMVKNVVYVPHKRQPDGWASDDGLFGKTNYQNMLNSADSVQYLKGDLYDKSEIVRALYERNHVMVDNSDIVIALYPDNQWKDLKGGTAECMRYAHSHGKPIKQITYTINDDGELIPTGLLQINPGKEPVTLRASLEMPELNI